MRVCAADHLLTDTQAPLWSIETPHIPVPGPILMHTKNALYVADKKLVPTVSLNRLNGVRGTSSVCLPLQDESLYVFPNCKSLWIKAFAK